MKVLIQRDQRSALIGSKPVFVFTVRAQVTAEEDAAIKKYKLGDTELYSNRTYYPEVDGVKSAAKELLARAKAASITVKELVSGKKFECKDILEMIDMEEELRKSAVVFENVLDAAMHFGGEEVLEL